jgi:hypothetical protein
MAIRRPVESDFEVVCHEFDVQVTFKPANSHYGCDVLTDGRLSPSGPTVRHDGITGNTGEYPSSEVRLMALATIASGVAGEAPARDQRCALEGSWAAHIAGRVRELR